MKIPFSQGIQSEAGSAKEKSAAVFRRPGKSDGARVWRLVNDCPPLDANSMYCNLLQCTDFADTCILCERDGEAVGWVSGYRLPQDAATLFIWQVAVHQNARGEGLAKRMLKALLSSAGCAGVDKLRTTITGANDASWSLFRSLAEELDAPLAREAWFDRDLDFAGAHDTEHLVSIGPFTRPAAESETGSSE